MNQGQAECLLTSWRPATEALKTLIGTARLPASFTRFTLLAERPVAVLRNTLEMWSAVILEGLIKAYDLGDGDVVDR